MNILQALDESIFCCATQDKVTTSFLVVRPRERNAAYGHTQEIPKAPKRRGEASVRFGQQREPSRESVPRDFHSGHSSTQAEDAHGNATSLLPKSQTYDSEFQSAKVARIAGGIDEASFLIEIMKKTPLFRNVCTQEAAELISDMTRHTFRANQYLARSGAVGDSMFFVIDGELQILARHRKIATLSRGDFFGMTTLGRIAAMRIDSSSTKPQGHRNLESCRRSADVWAIRNGMALELRVDALLSAVFRVSPLLDNTRAISDAHSESDQQEQRKK